MSGPLLSPKCSSKSSQSSLAIVENIKVPTFSLEITFKSQECTMQSLLIQSSSLIPSTFGFSKVPSINPTFLFAPSAIWIVSFPVNGLVMRNKFGSIHFGLGVVELRIEDKDEDEWSILGLRIRLEFMFAEWNRSHLWYHSNNTE